MTGPAAATILIVDDEMQNRKLIETMLRPEGYLTCVAANGEDALALIAERPPDLILLDIMLPGMDGYQVARTLKANPATATIPIIMVTALLDRSARLAGLEAGAEEFLTKPVERAELWLRVRNLLRLKAYRDFLQDHAWQLEQQVQARTASLQTSESIFRQMAENIRDVFFLQDAGGQKMLYISPAFEEIWGRSCESVYARPNSWTDAIHPEDRDRADATYRNGMVSGKFENAYRIVRPDGEVRFIEARVFPVHDDLGQLIRVAGVAEDVTQRKQAERELQQSRQRLDGIVTSALDAIVTVDEDQRIVLSNPAFERMFGYSAAELQGQSLDLVVPGRFRQAHAAHFTAFGESGIPARRMGAMRPVGGLRKNGEEFPIEASISKDDSTGRRFFTAILRDITERRNADARIAYLNRVYAVLSGINTLIVHAHDRAELFNEACRITVETGRLRMSWIGIVDPALKKIDLVASTGLDEVLMLALKDGLSACDGSSLDTSMAGQAIRDRQAVVLNDLRNSPRLGHGKRHAEAGIHSMAIFPLIVAGDAIGVFALCASEVEFFHAEELALLSELAGDIAFAIDHIAKQDRLEYLAFHDVLTGLAKRTLYLERVTQQLRRAADGGYKLALFTIDVERFKSINETLGRPAGDALLLQVALWLSHNAGDANLVARLDADHFAVLLPLVRDKDDLARVVDATHEAFMAHPFRVNDTDLRVAARIGIALYPEDGADAETLLKNAEAALKKAKTSGERCLFYTQAMGATAAGRLALENQLRHALERGEFVLHYQPKVDLATGKVTSAEALLRWNDPGSGLVAPGRFIPILEETGLIQAVGRWVLSQALADYLRWCAAGLNPVRIAVNLSLLQLRHRGFADEIALLVATDPQAAAALELEITESLIMEDVDQTIISLQAIRAMGVTIAIDDFGTGFSSLAYLAKLPVDTLKIDRSFIIDMTSGPDGLALVSTIINLAHSLKLKVVAEGVETEEQASLLRLLGCEEMQGYLFSKPVAAADFEARFLAPLAAIVA